MTGETLTRDEHTKEEVTRKARLAMRLPGLPVRVYCGDAPTVAPVPGRYLTLHADIDALLDILFPPQEDTA